MTLEYKNENGFIKGYISWVVITDEDVVSDEGTRLMILGCWIHESEQDGQLLKTMFKDLFKHKTTQNTLYVCYTREKYNERHSGMIPISKFLKYIGGNNG